MDSEKDPNDMGGSLPGKSPAGEAQASESAPAVGGGAESAASSDESAEEKRARMMAEIKAKAAARMAAKGSTPAKTETPAAPPAATTPAVATPATADAPSGETPEEKRARLIAETKAKAAARMAAKGDAPTTASAPPAAQATAEVSATPRVEVPSGTPPAARTAPGAAKSTATPTGSIAAGIPSAVAAKQHPTTVDTISEPPINKMRRRIVWASIVGFVGTSLLMFFRFFLPRTIFEPASIFRVGFPGDYGVGVDTKYQQLYRIWVVKTSDRLFVINAVCTHLGCTPDWKASENKFKCPCHGSGYDSEGINFEGPAPRPMDRAHVELDAQGQLVVNKGRLYDWPKGGENKFDEPGAYIPL